jgi:hypothetical protein
MANESRQQLRIREQIAHLAARLMAEDGIEDMGAAKRKAARQLGAGDTRNLPANEEVESALHSYRSIYQAEEHRDRLQALRLLALDMMASLEKFDPHLSGSVLNGNAGRHAEIHIDLFTDSPKAVEYFFVNCGIEFKSAERRMYFGECARSVPGFELETEDATYRITVFQPQDLRTAVKATPAGKPIERIRADRLRSMIALEQPGG